MMRAKRVLALLLAALLAIGCAGCSMASPQTVGTVGGEEIPAGLYLALQMNAFSEAMTYRDDPNAELLGAALTVEGQATTGAEFVARRTRELVGDYAAVRSLFRQMGGQLTAEQSAQAKAYAADVWASGKEVYQKNGVGQASLELFMEYMTQRDALLELVYGAQGTQAVSRQEMQDFVTESCRRVQAISFPLVNFSTYHVLDEEGNKTVTDLAGQAADRMKAGEDPAQVAGELLPAAYELLGMEFSAADVSVSPVVFTPSQMEYYGQDIAGQLMAAKPGDTLVLDLGMARNALLVLEPLPAADQLPEDEMSLLAEMKMHDLDELLQQTAAELDWALDQKAMDGYSAKKVQLS